MSAAADRQAKLSRTLTKLDKKALKLLGNDVAAASAACALSYTSDDGATKTMPILLAPALLAKADATEDILTTDQFGDFELVLDWKIGTGGNSGIFYRGSEEFERVYWSAPEYQLLDDANARDGRNRLTSAASAYGLYAAPAGILKPAGEWNTTRIIARGAHVEHWLNGQKVVQYELWSPDWEAKVNASKFKEWPKYGRGKSGHIAIQGDHEGMLALRNIKIRTLP